MAIISFPLKTFYLIDSDQDGLTDIIENTITHTNPQLNDTDSDGLSDHLELTQWATNPLKTDTDEDGIDDLTETTIGTNPLMSDNPVIMIISQLLLDDNDRDGDGVSDDIDNCPDIKNANQEDSNHNGIGRACDFTESWLYYLILDRKLHLYQKPSNISVPPVVWTMHKK